MRVGSPRILSLAKAADSGGYCWARPRAAKACPKSQKRGPPSRARPAHGRAQPHTAHDRVEWTITHDHHHQRPDVHVEVEKSTVEARAPPHAPHVTRQCTERRRPDPRSQNVCEICRPQETKSNRVEAHWENGNAYTCTRDMRAPTPHATHATQRSPTRAAHSPLRRTRAARSGAASV